MLNKGEVFRRILNLKEVIKSSVIKFGSIVKIPMPCLTLEVFKILSLKNNILTLEEIFPSLK